MDEECKSWVTRTNFSRTIYHRLDSATLPQLDLEHGSKKPKNPNNSSDHSNLFNSISLPNDIGIRQSSMDSNPSSSSVHCEGDLRSDSESKQRSISLDSRSAAAQPSNLLHFLGRVSSVKIGGRKERNWGKYFDHGVGKVAAVDIADEWKVDLSQLYLGFRFAIGSNSRLYHGVYKEKNVAVKIIQVPDEEDDENGMAMAARLENQYSREVNFLSQLQHRNVIKLVAACKNPPVFCIITEYLSGGSLRAFLHKLEHEPLALQKVISIALDIARGMEYIHSQGVIHRDLKPENILLDEELCVKIADFGIACEDACSDQLSEDPGTYRWMAPEMIKHQHCGKKVDVYSFGLILWEMVTGRVPYEDMTQIQAAFAVVDKNMRPTIPPDCPATLRTLMEQCWASVPGKRPDFRQIIKVLDQFESNFASEIMPDQPQNLTSREKKKDLRHWIQKFKGRLAGPKAL